MTLDEVITGIREEMGLGDPVLADALHYLKEFRVVTDIAHEHGIASVWGQVLPDVEKTDWDKKLNLDNAFNNDPLTWEQLKQMEGKPVWVEYDRSIRNKWGCKRWHVIRWIQTVTFDGKDHYWMRVDEDGIYFDKDEQGKTWLAYRKER